MIFILNRHCPLYGLQSKKQLAEILHITDKNLLKGKTQDEINIYIATEPKERLIEAPSHSIKKSQEIIKNLLMKCDIPYYVFSGVKGKSYYDNAVIHKECKYMYKTDISAFFPSISRDLVYNFFRYELNTSSDVAKILADICTVDISAALETDATVKAFITKKKIRMKNHLCTGSPASPILSYLVNRKMFDEMYKIAQNNNLFFSVYMDDVFFSSKKWIPLSIREQILKTLTKNGYNIASRKVVYYSEKDNKKITGVIITPDNNLGIPNKLKRKIVNGFSRGKLTVKEECLKGMLVAAKMIDKNSFNGINSYINQRK